MVGWPMSRIAGTKSINAAGGGWGVGGGEGGGCQSTIQVSGFENSVIVGKKMLAVLGCLGSGVNVTECKYK